MRVLAAVILNFIVMTGCGEPLQPKKPVETDRYYHSAGYFSIKFPKNWEQKDDPAEGIFAFPKPDEEDEIFRQNVNVAANQLDHSESLDLYVKIAIKDTSPDVKILEEGKVDLSNDKAHRLILSHSMPGKNVIVKVLVYIVVNQRRAYVVTCTALEATFDKHLPQFEEIAKSFRVEK